MILFAFGTRPEWLKIKPLIDCIDGNIKYKLLYINQHENIVDETINNYKYDKLLIKEQLNNRLDSIVCSILKEIDNYLTDVDYVLVQGDTTTAFAISLACFHRKIKVIHLEAGLRTWDNQHPYPEEFNRQSISSIADLNLCPTKDAAQNLINENKNTRIEIVGNTILDNLKNIITSKKNIVLITLHRRENHDIIYEWFKEIDNLALQYKDIEFILPIHPNPNIIKHKHFIKNIKICNPLQHNQLIEILKNSKLVITDSGGIQEEAAFLFKPCIVCRKKTERHEGLNIFSWLCKSPNELSYLFELLKNHEIDKNNICPYGDGYASEKIFHIMKEIISNEKI